LITSHRCGGRSPREHELGLGAADWVSCVACVHHEHHVRCSRRPTFCALQSRSRSARGGSPTPAAANMRCITHTIVGRVTSPPFADVGTVRWGVPFGRSLEAQAGPNDMGLLQPVGGVDDGLRAPRSMRLIRPNPRVRRWSVVPSFNDRQPLPIDSSHPVGRDPLSAERTDAGVPRARKGRN